MSKAPDYCHWKPGRRDGPGFWYYVRKGYQRVRLPGLPWSPEFMAAYEKASKAAPAPVGAERTVQGSLNALIIAYYGSSDWRRLAPTTQRTYRGVLERMREDLGKYPVAGFEPKHVFAIIEKRSGTPAAANRVHSLLEILLDYAVKIGTANGNPARLVKKLRYKKEGFHTWTDGEVRQFRAHWPIGTRERLALELLLTTSQRSGDVRTMGLHQIAGDEVSFVQGKTGQPVWLPLTDELAAALKDTALIGRETILVTGHGKPFSEKYFYNWFKRASKAAGLPHCCPHGLRKTAARQLAESGCTELQIQAVTGHRTSKEVSRYTKEANRKLLAQQAFKLRSGTQNEQ
ncbi:MAG: tyrosine-type recombinase/integrase [Rhodomicrobium sp.]